MAQPVALEENLNKNYLIALVLSAFLGTIGLDRFYLKRNVTGVLKLITAGGLGIWWLIDLILVGLGKLREKGDNRPLEHFTKYGQQLKPVVIIMAVIQVLAILVTVVFITVAAALGFWAQDKTTNVMDRYNDSSNQLMLPQQDSGMTQNDYDSMMRDARDSMQMN